MEEFTPGHRLINPDGLIFGKESVARFSNLNQPWLPIKGEKEGCDQDFNKPSCMQFQVVKAISNLRTQ